MSLLESTRREVRLDVNGQQTMDNQYILEYIIVTYYIPTDN